MPIMVKKVVEKAAGNFQQQYQSQYNTNTKSSGQDEIIYDTAQQTKPRETKKVGEYVDYEELD